MDKLLRRGVRDAVLEREANDFSLRGGGVEEHDRGGAGGGDLLRLPALMNDTHTHTERERERERGVSLKKKSNSLSGIAQTESTQFLFPSFPQEYNLLNFAYLFGAETKFEAKSQGDKKNKFSSRMSRIRAGLRTTRTATRL